MVAFMVVISFQCGKARVGQGWNVSVTFISTPLSSVESSTLVSIDTGMGLAISRQELCGSSFKSSSLSKLGHCRCRSLHVQ